MLRTTLLLVIPLFLFSCAVSSADPAVTPIITDGVQPTALEFVPQGKILILERQSEIYIANPDGTDKRLIVSSQNIRAAALSPDTKRLAYVIEGNTFLLELDGEEAVQLNQEPIGILFGGMQWSPDAKRLGFDCLVDAGLTSEICITDLESKKVSVLTNSSAFGAASLDGAAFGSWSRDGTKISYCLKIGGPEGGFPSTTFMLLDTQSLASQALVSDNNFTTPIHFSCPILHPRDNLILFTAKQGDDYAVFSMSLDGNELQRITETSVKFDVVDPIVISPDGDAFFAFAAQQGVDDPIGVPTLFSMDGRIILQLDFPDAIVTSWSLDSD